MTYMSNSEVALNMVNYQKSTCNQLK